MADILGQNPDDPNQTVTYRIDVDTSRVQAAIDQIQQAAQAAGSSVSGYASNQVNALAAATMANASAVPGLGSPLAPGFFGMGMSPQLAALYQRGQLTAPGQMARDAMAQMQPTDVAGLPVFNVAGAPAAPYAFNPRVVPEVGARRGSQMMFGWGSGSASDVASMGAMAALGGRIGNDNLEDRMFSSIERRMEGFANNLERMARFTGLEGGGGVLGGMLGGALGGPVGAMAGSGFGMMMGRLGNRFIDERTRVFDQGSEAFRAYTQPFVEGSRLGGGMSYRDMAGFSQKLADRMTGDKWFTAREYQELISVAGETGQFQFTKNPEQALAAIDKIGESIKVLTRMGMRTRETLATITTAVNQFGVSPINPSQTANFFANMSLNASMAGTTLGNLTQDAVPFAQAGMAQNLGPGVSAQMYARNRAAATGMFTSGRMGAFENTYYGGAEGLANLQTQGAMAILRTPLGETNLMAALSDPETLKKAMRGDRIGVGDLMRGPGGLAAADPGKYMGMRMMLPKLTEALGPEGLSNVAGATVDQLYEQVRPGEKYDPTIWAALASQSFGLDTRTAMAMAESRAHGADALRERLGLARGEQMRQNLETMRGADVRRLWEHGVTDPLSRTAYGAVGPFRHFAREVAGTLQDHVTGVEMYRLGPYADTLTTPGAAAMEIAKARESLGKYGVQTMTSDTFTSPEGALQSATARAAGALSRGDGQITEAFRSEARRMGFSDEEVRNFTTIAQSRGAVQLSLEGDARKRAEAALLGATGADSVGAGIAALRAGGDAAASTFGRELRKRGLSQAYGDAVVSGDRTVTVDRDTVDEVVKKQMSSVVNRIAGDDPTRRGSQEAIARLADANQAGTDAASEQLRGEGFSQAEIDTYLKRTREDSTGTFVQRWMPGQQPGERSYDGPRSGERVAMSTERFNRIAGVFDERIGKPVREMQTENRGFIKGLADYREATSYGAIGNLLPGMRTRSTQYSLAEPIANEFVQSGGAVQTLDQVRGMTDPTAVADVFARRLFSGKGTGQLDEDQNRILAGVMANVGGRGIGSEEGQRALAVALSAEKATPDPASMTLQEIERTRQEKLSGMNSEVRNLAEGATYESASRKMTAAQRLGAMGILSSATSVEEAQASFARANLSAGQLEKMGINAKFWEGYGQDRAGALAGVSDQVLAPMKALTDSERVDVERDQQSLMGQTSTSWRPAIGAALGAAAGYLMPGGGLAGSITGGMLGRAAGRLMGGQPGLEQAIANTKTSTDYATFMQQMGSVNIGVSDQDLARFQRDLGSDRVGGKSIQDLFMGMRKDSVGGALDFTNALLSDRQAMSSLAPGAADTLRVAERLATNLQAGGEVTGKTLEPLSQLALFRGMSSEQLESTLLSGEGSKADQASGILQSLVRDATVGANKFQAAGTTNAEGGAADRLADVTKSNTDAIRALTEALKGAQSVQDRFQKDNGSSNWLDTIRQIRDFGGQPSGGGGAPDVGGALRSALAEYASGKALNVNVINGGAPQAVSLGSGAAPENRDVQAESLSENVGRQ